MASTLPRSLGKTLLAALADTPVVCLLGARQSVLLLEENRAP